jgi:peptide chain release factor 1
LETKTARHEEVGLLLSQPDAFSDQNRYRDLSVEYSQLEPLVTTYRKWRETDKAVKQAQDMSDDSERELRELADQELSLSSDRRDDLEDELQRLLLPKDPNDEKNIFLEVRAGTGGDEAALFAGDLFRM